MGNKWFLLFTGFCPDLTVNPGCIHCNVFIVVCVHDGKCRHPCGIYSGYEIVHYGHPAQNEKKPSSCLSLSPATFPCPLSFFTFFFVMYPKMSAALWLPFLLYSCYSVHGSFGASDYSWGLSHTRAGANAILTCPEPQYYLYSIHNYIARAVW